MVFRLSLILLLCSCSVVPANNKRVILRKLASRNHYDTLGIGRKATADDIKLAYRDKARELHPDRNKDDPRAEEKLKDINIAHDVLKDPQKKAVYDRQLDLGIEPEQETSFFVDPEVINILSPYLKSDSPQDQEYLPRFKNRTQIQALRVAVKVRGRAIRYDYEKLLKYETSHQVEAMRIAALGRGALIYYDHDKLLNFSNQYQVQALMASVGARRNSIKNDYNDLLKFSNIFQVEALETVAQVRGKSVYHDYDKLLSFSNQYQVQALRLVAKIRGKSVYHDYESLLKFNSEEQVKALAMLVKLKQNDIYHAYEGILSLEKESQYTAMNLGYVIYGPRYANYFKEFALFTNSVHSELVDFITKVVMSKSGLLDDANISLDSSDFAAVKDSAKREGLEDNFELFSYINTEDKLIRFKQAYEQTSNLKKALDMVFEQEILARIDELNRTTRSARSIGELSQILNERKNLMIPGADKTARLFYFIENERFILSLATSIQEISYFARDEKLNAADMIEKYLNMKIKDAKSFKAVLVDNLNSNLSEETLRVISLYLSLNLYKIKDYNVPLSDWLTVLSYTDAMATENISFNLFTQIKTVSNLSLLLDKAPEILESEIAGEELSRIVKRGRDFNYLIRSSHFTASEKKSRLLALSYFSQAESLSQLIELYENIDTESRPIHQAFNQVVKQILDQRKVSFSDLKRVSQINFLSKETKVHVLDKAIPLSPNLKELESLNIAWYQLAMSRALRRSYAKKKGALQQQSGSLWQCHEIL